MRASNNPTEKCPYDKTNADREQQLPSASPQEVLPTTSAKASPKPPQHQQGWTNLRRMLYQGPSIFFSKMASRTTESFFQIEVGTKRIYQVTNGEIATALHEKYGKFLGRGSSFEPFKSMVGDVFFANDGPLATETRHVFLNSVTRLSENFERIAKINQRTFTAIQLNEGKIDDLFAIVAWHTMGCIASCFVGTNDLSAISPKTHETFLKATRQITQASMDPLSRLLHPYLRSEFREASAAMAIVAKNLLHSNVDAICQGNNYIWDLGVFRAQQMFPDMKFDNCTHFDEGNIKAQIIRDLIKKDRFILDHGPLTIFASSNVGATLFYLLDVLSSKPEIIDNMRMEINGVLSGEEFTYRHISRLPYVRSVVQEALRQATPIPTFPREVLEPFDAQINGKTVSFKKGDMLMLSFRPMHECNRDFMPAAGGISPTLFSFGIGPRRCPARPFAEQLLTQFLVNMTTQNLHIVLTKKVSYTVKNGNLGPDYEPANPITAEVRYLESQLKTRSTARL